MKGKNMRDDIKEFNAVENVARKFIEANFMMF